MRQSGARIVDGDGAAYFVEGIGPPLQQIAHDYRSSFPKSQSTHDVLSLIDHIDQLEQELVQIKEELIATKKAAEEGWAWLDDALKALGVKTVFDIPKVA